MSHDMFVCWSGLRRERAMKMKRYVSRHGCFTICLCILQVRSTVLWSNRGSKHLPRRPVVLIDTHIHQSNRRERSRLQRPQPAPAPCALFAARYATKASDRACSLSHLSGAGQATAPNITGSEEGQSRLSREGAALHIHTRLPSGPSSPSTRSDTARNRRQQNHLPLHPLPTTMSDVLANPKLCKNCGTPGCEFKCQCKLGYYCSRGCQKAHWHLLKKECAIHLSRKVKDAKREHGKDGVEAAKARLDVGYSHLNQGRYKEAERYFVEARQIYTHAYGDAHFDVGTACSGLGKTYCRTGRYEGAIGLLDKALGIFRTTKGERSPEAGLCLMEIGSSLYHQDKLDEALARLEEALSICTEAGGSEHSSVASVLTNMGNCFGKMGRLDEALAKHKRALVINRKVDGNEHPNVAASLHNIGSVFTQKGMFVEARAKFEEALEIKRRVRGEKHPSVANSLSCVASILSNQGQLNEALEMYEKALKIQRRALGEDHVSVAQSLEHIGLVYSDQGKHAEALEMYDKALATYDHALSSDSRKSAHAHCRIACSKNISGDLTGALASARESVRIYTKLGITDSPSQKAANIVSELEGVA